MARERAQRGYAPSARQLRDLARQARLLAYVDVIWIMAAVTIILTPLPFLMKRPPKTSKIAVGH